MPSLPRDSYAPADQPTLSWQTGTWGNVPGVIFIIREIDGEEEKCNEGAKKVVEGAMTHGRVVTE